MTQVCDNYLDKKNNQGLCHNHYLNFGQCSLNVYIIHCDDLFAVVVVVLRRRFPRQTKSKRVNTITDTIADLTSLIP